MRRGGLGLIAVNAGLSRFAYSSGIDNHRPAWFQPAGVMEVIMNNKILLLTGAAMLGAISATASAQSQQQDPGNGPYWGHMHMHPGYGHGAGPGRWQWMPDDQARPGGRAMQGYGPGQRGQHMPGRGRFAMIDANEDGKVSAEEAASAADDVFSAMDSDDDGMLTKEEYMSVRMGPQTGRNPARQQKMQAAKEARFDDMDKEKDGSITKAEFMTMAENHHRSADTDGDGTITPWEHRRRNWN